MVINRSDLEAFDYYDEQKEDYDYMDSWKSFDAFQSFTDMTAIYPEDKGLEYVALGLASEAGELAGKVKKFIRDGTFNLDEMVSELGDVMWYSARMAEELGVYMSDVAKANVDKLEDRLARGKIKGSGDNR